MLYVDRSLTIDKEIFNTCKHNRQTYNHGTVYTWQYTTTGCSTAHHHCCTTVCAAHASLQPAAQHITTAPHATHRRNIILLGSSLPVSLCTIFNLCPPVVNNCDATGLMIVIEIQLSNYRSSDSHSC